jgi:hypothetical protein
MAATTVVFDALDRDRDGQIGRADLEHLVAALSREAGIDVGSTGWRRLRAALGNLWELIELSIDVDDSGTVDRDELQRFADQLGAQIRGFGGAPPAVVEVVQALWTALDADGDGEITEAEFTAFLRAAGAEGGGGFAEIDANRDGRVGIDELERRVIGWLTA